MWARIPTVVEWNNLNVQSVHGQEIGRRLANAHSDLVPRRVSLPATRVRIKGWPWTLTIAEAEGRVEATLKDRIKTLSQAGQREDLEKWLNRFVEFQVRLWQEGVWNKDLNFSNYGIIGDTLVLLDHDELTDDLSEVEEIFGSPDMLGAIERRMMLPGHLVTSHAEVYRRFLARWQEVMVLANLETHWRRGTDIPEAPNDSTPTESKSLGQIGEELSRLLSHGTITRVILDFSGSPNPAFLGDIMIRLDVANRVRAFFSDAHCGVFLPKYNEIQEQIFPGSVLYRNSEAVSEAIAQEHREGGRTLVVRFWEGPIEHGQRAFDSDAVLSIRNSKGVAYADAHSNYACTSTYAVDPEDLLVLTNRYDRLRWVGDRLGLPPVQRLLRDHMRIPNRKEWLDQLGVHFDDPNRPLIFINPFASRMSKNLTVADWARIIQSFASEPVNLLVNRGPPGNDEMDEYFQQLQGQSLSWPANVHFVPEDYSLDKFVPTLTVCDLLVGSDSASLHFAHMLDVPSFTFFLGVRGREILSDYGVHPPGYFNPTTSAAWYHHDPYYWKGFPAARDGGLTQLDQTLHQAHMFVKLHTGRASELLRQVPSSELLADLAAFERAEERFLQARSRRELIETWTDFRNRVLHLRRFLLPEEAAIVFSDWNDTVNEVDGFFFGRSKTNKEALPQAITEGFVGPKAVWCQSMVARFWNQWMVIHPSGQTDFMGRQKATYDQRWQKTQEILMDPSKHPGTWQDRQLFDVSLDAGFSNALAESDIPLDVVSTLNQMGEELRQWGYEPTDPGNLHITLFEVFHQDLIGQDPESYYANLNAAERTELEQRYQAVVEAVNEMGSMEVIIRGVNLMPDGVITVKGYIPSDKLGRLRQRLGRAIPEKLKWKDNVLCQFTLAVPGENSSAHFKEVYDWATSRHEQAIGSFYVRHPGLVAVSNRRTNQLHVQANEDLRIYNQQMVENAKKQQVKDVQPTPNAVMVRVYGENGSGKSTAAKSLAARLGFVHLDSGAIYRALTEKAISAGMDLSYRGAIGWLIENTTVDLIPSGGGVRVIRDGEDVSDRIRTPEVSRAVSILAQLPIAQAFVVLTTSRISRNQNTVLDGRYTGKKTFAHLPGPTFYLFATLEERAKRRLAEYSAKQPGITLEQVMEDIRRRDQEDSTRTSAPMQEPPDAIRIDTSEKTPAEVVDEMEHITRQHLEKNEGIGTHGDANSSPATRMLLGWHGNLLSAVLYIARIPQELLHALGLVLFEGYGVRETWAVVDLNWRQPAVHAETGFQVALLGVLGNWAIGLLALHWMNDMDSALFWPMLALAVMNLAEAVLSTWPYTINGHRSDGQVMLDRTLEEFAIRRKNGKGLKEAA